MGGRIGKSASDRGSHALVPVHLGPKALLSLQHADDELSPLLLHVVGVVTLWQLNSAKLDPHLPPENKQTRRISEANPTASVSTEAVGYGVNEYFV